MGVTPIYALPYPSLSDPPNGPAQFQALAESVEDELARIDTNVTTNTSNITTNTTALARLGIVAWGNRTTPSTTTTTTVGVLRFDDIPVVSTTSYVVEATNVIIESTVASDAIQADFRYTTDGSTPTTASPTLPGTIIYGRIIVGNSGESRVIRCVYVPPVNQTLSVLLCVSRIGGTGNVRLFSGASDRLEVAIYKVGTAVTNTATSI